MRLAPGYGNRRVVSADRAAGLLAAATVAMTDDGASISAYEMDVRRRELRRIAAAARISLMSAVSWID